MKRSKNTGVIGNNSWRDAMQAGRPGRVVVVAAAAAAAATGPGTPPHARLAPRHVADGPRVQECS